ncbi:uncharacterized protein LOC121379856 [Gigantopelta aegis]|uniref:uncharacterized protein LOC121379856 n=1 Tax=Gigantopelta aegis TaxID=1735272 RepID=UPI001B889268|nr:uncharacterized protein LOC121379856 [Gigantopelta aegis]
MLHTEEHSTGLGYEETERKSQTEIPEIKQHSSVGKRSIELGELVEFPGPSGVHVKHSTPAYETRTEPSSSESEHTGELESFHNLILMYASKRFTYSYPVYKTRNYLAAIAQRKKEIFINFRYHRIYSKRSKTWSVVPVLEKKLYQYIPELLTQILQKRIDEAYLTMQCPVTMSQDDPRRISRTIAEVEPESTEVLVSKKRSRFQ